MCSIHFLDGSPTTANPNPTLHLGYALFAFPPVGQQTTNYKKRNYIISKLHVTETVLAEYQPTNDHRDIAADHRYSLPDNNFEKCDILMSHLKKSRSENDQLSQKLSKSITSRHTQDTLDGVDTVVKSVCVIVTNLFALHDCPGITV